MRLAWVLDPKRAILHLSKPITSSRNHQYSSNNVTLLKSLQILMNSKLWSASEKIDENATWKLCLVTLQMQSHFKQWAHKNSEKQPQKSRLQLLSSCLSCSNASRPLLTHPILSHTASHSLSGLPHKRQKANNRRVGQGVENEAGREGRDLPGHTVANRKMPEN